LILRSGIHNSAAIAFKIFKKSRPMWPPLAMEFVTFWSLFDPMRSKLSDRVNSAPQSMQNLRWLCLHTRHVPSLPWCITPGRNNPTWPHRVDLLDVAGSCQFSAVHSNLGDQVGVMAHIQIMPSRVVCSLMLDSSDPSKLTENGPTALISYRAIDLSPLRQTELSCCRLKANRHL
jgi:hypothetical protein